MVLFFLPYSIRTLLASLTFLCCNIFAAYHSFKAIHHRRLNTSSHWLFYWTIVACLVMIHSNSFIHDMIHTLVPLYPELRIAIHLFTLSHPVRCLSHLVLWLSYALSVLRVRYFLTVGAIFVVRTLQNLVRMGVFNDSDSKLLEELKNVTNQTGFDIAVVSNNRKRASLQRHADALVEKLSQSVHVVPSASAASASGLNQTRDDDLLLLNSDAVPSVKGRVTLF